MNEIKNLLLQFLPAVFKSHVPSLKTCERPLMVAYKCEFETPAVGIIKEQIVLPTQVTFSRRKDSSNLPNPTQLSQVYEPFGPVTVSTSWVG